MAPKVGRRENVMEANISYDLERLFDPYNFDHIPYEKRLALFKQRDLPHIKHYKAAVKIFGGPHVRTRAIVAPPMETPLKHRLGLYSNVFEPPPPPALNGPLKPPPEPVKLPTKEEKAAQDEEEKIANYKSWISQRKKLRGDLDNLGLSEALLAKKPDKTELEKRVQAKFRRDRLWKPPSPPPPEEKPPPKPVPDVPKVAVPPPDGLQILDKFLSLNRMRLMDLFQIADKDKSWSLSREEMVKAVTQSAIPLSETEIDDMMIALDNNLDDELTYKEMNEGLTKWRKQRRDLKRQGVADGASTVTSTGQQSKKPSTSQTQRVGGSQTPPKDVKSLSREPTKEKLLEKENTASSLARQSSKEKISRESMKKSGSKEMLAGSREKLSDSREKLFSSKEKLSGSVELLTREKTMTSGKGSSIGFDIYREKSNVSLTKTSSQGKRLQIIDSDTDPEASVTLPASRGNQSSIQNGTLSEIAPQADSNLDKSEYEDALFQGNESPRAFTSTEMKERVETGKESEKTKPSSDTEDGTGTRTASRKPGSAHSTSSRARSRSSTPNTLEPPEFDVREECRAPESDEAMLDTRKHDRVVLSRNNIKRSLSREQKVLFDELPGVIKVGYKPIDDHCADSTLTGEVASGMNQFRREKLKEYFEVRKVLEENGLYLNEKTLDRVLLYPGDKPPNYIKKNILAPLGPLTNELSPFNQPKPKKKSKKKRRGLGRHSRASGVSATSGAPGGGSTTPGGNTSRMGAAPPEGPIPDDRSGSASSKRSLITVEDVYPFASTVAPKVYKENLSSGRALITRKVDNWMTFEEYNKYTDEETAMERLPSEPPESIPPLQQAEQS